MKWQIPEVLRSVGADSLLKNSMALMSGTMLSQGIIFLLSPLLSRLFGLVDFGRLANFNAWVSLLALLGSLRYEHAIIVAKDRESTNGVVVLTTLLSLISVAGYSLAAVLIHVLKPDSRYLTDIRDIVLFVPVGVLFISVSALFIQLNVRAGKFHRLAVVGVAQVAFTVATQVVLGLVHVPNGLIIGTIAGAVFSGAMLGWLLLREGGLRGVHQAMTLRRLQTTACHFVNFPRYTLAADALNVVVQQFTPVFILALFNPGVAGLYSFSIRIVRVPLLVVSTAIGSVLRKVGVERLNSEGNLRALYGPIVRGLFLLGLIPFFVILFLGRQLFSLVFGAQWAEAGRVVQILSPGILLEFVSFPLAAFFLITNSQYYTFRLQAMGFVLLIAALVAGRAYLSGFMATCVLLSGVMVVVNTASIVLASRVSKIQRVVTVSPQPIVSAV